MMLRRVIFSTLVFVCSSVLYAQQIDIEKLVSDMLEEMVLDERLTEDDEEAAAALIAQSQNPINVNTASREELLQLFFLTENQIDAILKRREFAGELLTPQELMLTGEFASYEVERLSYFITFNEAERQRGTAIKGNVIGRVQRTFPKQQGYKAKTDTTDAAYIGSPYRVLLRAAFDVGSCWSAGFVAENDPGEAMFSHGTSLTDFVSAYLQYKPKEGFLRSALVGHYHAQYGQGLGLWTGFSADASSMVGSIEKRARGIVATLSASEYGYLRGAAVALGRDKLRLDAFFSHVDGDISTDTDDDGNTYGVTVQSSGYHRTNTERARRNNLQQILTGTYVSTSLRMLRAGVGYNMWHTSIPLGNDATTLYRKYYPTGSYHHTVHADYKFYSSKIIAYGEVAWQSAGAFAGMQGIDVPLGGGNNISMAFRKFGKKYSVNNQSPFSRTSNPGGETGFYAAVQLAPFRHFTLMANVNVYDNEWLKYLKYAPTDGYKCRMTMQYHPSTKSVFAFKLRHEEYEAADEDNSKQTADIRKTSARLQYTHNVSSRLRLATSVERSWYGQVDASTSDGFWISQEFKMNFERPDIDATLLVAHFDTDDYNSRIYAYMPDVLYAMSIPSYYYRGIVAVGNMKYSPCRGINIWLWANYMKYYNRSTISSGNSLIDASHKIDVKLQVQIKLYKFIRRDAIS